MNKLVASLFTAMLLAALAQSPAVEAQDQAPAVAAERGVQGPTQFPANSVVFAELSKSLDARKAKTGDPVEAKTTMDVLSQGKIVIPRNIRIIGHVIGAKAHSKESPDSYIEIMFDRAIAKDGRELPLTASVQAIGAAVSSISTSEGATTGERSPDSVNLPNGRLQRDPHSALAPEAPGAMIPNSEGGGDPELPGAVSSSENHARHSHSLGPSSHGVIGMKGLELKNSGQSSVVSCRNKNVHLDSGTQLMLNVH